MQLHLSMFQKLRQKYITAIKYLPTNSLCATKLMNFIEMMKYKSLYMWYYMALCVIHFS